MEHKTGSSFEDLKRDLGLIMRRLDALEDVIVLGNKVYMKVPSETDEKRIETQGTSMESKLVLKTKQAKVGEDVNLSIEISNQGATTVLLAKIERVLPAGFELTAKPDYCSFVDEHIDMNSRRLDASRTEEVGLALRSFYKGSFELRPRITYLDQAGHQIISEPEPSAISILENTLPDRISTGHAELDSLLLGGIPEKYAAILTSASCDERDFLVEKFLETGVEKGEATFYLCIQPSGVKTLAEEYQSSFYLFICNPQADIIIKSLPNVFKLKGVENLININIALTAAFRKLGASHRSPRRACIGIISDVLLQHHAIQTRRWLAGLIPELRSKGFTTLAVMNPYMHPREEVQAVLDLFDGEISIYEKNAAKTLKVSKLRDERYLDAELPLRKVKPGIGLARAAI